MKLSLFFLVGVLSLGACTFTPKVSIHAGTTTNGKPEGDTLKFPKANRWVNDFNSVLTESHDDN